MTRARLVDPEAATKRRAARYKLRRLIGARAELEADLAGSWDGIPTRRQASCGFALGDAVGVAYSASSGTCYPAANVSMCGSVWACPVCSAKVRQARTADVEAVARWHGDQGGELVMLTLTLRHTKGDRLGPLVHGLSEAWRRVQRRAWWGIVRDNSVGQVRALEVTHGFADDHGSGWHPHLHVLVLASGTGIGADLLAGHIERNLAASWSDAVVAELGEAFAPDDAIGVDVRCIEAGAASYVTKISQEVTRSDLKSGARSVWWLAEAGRWEEFAEYAAAMKGRRAVQFSRGLRELVGLGVDQADEALMLLDLDEGVIVTWVERRRWDAMVRDGVVVEFLRALELRCASVRSVPPNAEAPTG